MIFGYQWSSYFDCNRLKMVILTYVEGCTFAMFTGRYIENLQLAENQPFVNFRLCEGYVKVM